LARDPLFEQISPEVGRLDESAFDDALHTDPDGALALLASMTNAVDEELRRRALVVACSVFIDIARGLGPTSGSGRLASRPLDPGSGADIDIDRAPEVLALRRRGVDTGDEIHQIDWAHPPTSVCLVIDRSGSMSGASLATAALAAAAVCLRLPGRHGVVSFAGDVSRHVEPGDSGEAEQVVSDILALRGHGTTGLRAALDAAVDVEIARPTGRHVTVVLSDCRATEEDGVEAAAARLSDLVILAPADDADAAASLAARVGAHLERVAGPSDVIRALGGAFSRR